MSVSSAKRRVYRHRGSRSLCRKKTEKKCHRVKGCKRTRATAKRASYCRKSKRRLLK